MMRGKLARTMVGTMTGVMLVSVAGVLSSCGGGGSEPSGDQAAAAEAYVRVYSASNPDCVLSAHKKVDDATATALLQAYEAYEVSDYAKEEEAYVAIDDSVEQELTVALNKCALG